MIPALRQARRISRAALALGAVASLALVGHLAIDAPASSAAQTKQPTPAASTRSGTSAPTTSRGTGSSSSSSSSPSTHASRHTFSKVPSVSTPSASRTTQAQTHSS